MAARIGRRRADGTARSGRPGEGATAYAESVESSRRRRGRPRKDAEGEARERIIEAATVEFGEKGYEGASLRAIARRAGVDAALVHHYFDDRAAILAEVVRIPVRPDRIVRDVLAGPLDTLGETLTRTVLETWERPAVRPAAVAIMRAAVGTSAGGRLVREFLTRELIGAIAARLPGEDAALRAALAGSQVAGVLMMRYVARVEPVASAPLEELVARIAPVVQQHLTGGSSASA